LVGTLLTLGFRAHDPQTLRLQISQATSEIRDSDHRGGFGGTGCHLSHGGVHLYRAILRDHHGDRTAGIGRP
jgi:hypothetical protein